MRTLAAQTALVAAALLLLLASAPSGEDKRLAVFAPQARFAIPIVEKQGREYVDAFELLRGLGQVSTTDDHGKWKIVLGDVEGRFEDGSDRARIRGSKVALGAKFLGSGGAALLPLRGVPAVLSAFLNKPIDFHEGARRVFVGDVGTHFTAELRRSGERSSLVLTFSAPVNPTISTEPGALHMIFARDPVVATTEHFSFDDKLIAGANYSESEGLGRLTVDARAPLMATFADEGRTIIVSAAPTAGAATQVPAAPAASSEASPSPVAPPAATAAAPVAPVSGAARPRFLVVIDPAHGGEETGVAFSSKLLEKDLTLALGRRLRTELANRGVNAMLLRDSDSEIPPDQRAVVTNAGRAALYISLHAGAPGTRVRVYTAMLQPTPSRPGSFLPWDSAQSSYLGASSRAADEIVSELKKHQLAAAQLPGPVRPLASIAAPAVAVEISPTTEDAASMADGKYQQNVAVAVAAAVAALRGGGEPR